MRFNNIGNKQIKDETGKTYWISRSVVTIFFVKCRGKFLVVKRGPYVTQTGKWCLPCGYLDWNETLSEGAVREVYEESGLDLGIYVDVSNLQPFRISSDPKSTKMQNISFEFMVDLGDIDFPETKIIDPNETLDIAWVGIDDLYKYKFTFNHDDKIIEKINE
jgi:ADP-ribose pyrophosphatase YjhB (NUDIX family)